VPKIAALEREIAELESRIAAAEFYSQPWDVTSPVLAALKARQEEHEQGTARWLELEEMQARLAGSQ
jgi:ABC transport system ATP-binding/permease protein